MNEVATAVSFLFAFVVVVVVVGWTVPWAAKLASLYELHNIRDRLFLAAEEHPEIRGTKVFRAVDRYLAIVIHVVRERSYWDLISFYSALRRPSAKTADEQTSSDRKVEEYQRELEAMPEEITDLLLESHKLSSVALAFAVALSHPFAIAILFPAALIVAAWTRPRPDATKIACSETVADKRDWSMELVPG